MAGTREGGIKAAKSNKLKYGKDYYAKLGKLGGHNGHTGGFAANPELARIAGAKGGKASKRGKSLTEKQKHAIAKREQKRIEKLEKVCESVSNGFKVIKTTR